MQKKRLGRTGLMVTVLGYGAGQLRGPRHWGGRPVTLQQADEILNAVLDAGINFIDTASIYGPSEEYIGRFLRQRRAEYFLATKCGCEKIPGEDADEHRRNWDPDFLMGSVDASLQRLQTDHLDLLQFHNPTFEDFEKNNLGVFMEKVRRSGKARFIGVSTTLPDLPRFMESDIFDTFQVPYSAQELEHERWLRGLVTRGCGTIIRGGVAQGIPLNDQSRSNILKNAEIVDLLNGMDPMEFMLRFTLSHPDVHTAIVATLMPNHLAQNVRAAEKGPLAVDLYHKAMLILSQRSKG